MTYKLDKARILIVDDMKPMLTLTKTVLGIFGFKEIYIASDGNEAFDLLCRHDPDLVITDWIMEPMDGLEFTKKIRKDPMSPNPYVPVIMMTGFSSRLRVEGARDAGVTEFLVKPFTSKDLYARVSQIIEKPRQFVDAGTFFGPDRRRKRAADYQGPRRRDAEPAEGAASLTSEEKKIGDILRKLREEAKNV
jgi:two-component system chemotaxis response regulator CheY